MAGVPPSLFAAGGACVAAHLTLNHRPPYPPPPRAIHPQCIDPFARAPRLVRRAILATYLLNKTENGRLVKAFSGQLPPSESLTVSEDRLKRRPSWSAKFEGNDVPKGLEEKLNAVSEERLARRPSWSAKFESGHHAPALEATLKDAEASLNEAAGKRLQRSASWAAKFEGPRRGDSQLFTHSSP